MFYLLRFASIRHYSPLSRDYEEVREIIPHIGSLPIVIPLKIFLDFLRVPVFPRGLIDSQSYVPILASVVRDSASNKNGKGYIHFVDERDFKEVSVVGKRK